MGRRKRLCISFRLVQMLSIRRFSTNWSRATLIWWRSPASINRCERKTTSTQNWGIWCGYDWHDPISQRIARVVDEADTGQEVTLEPAAPGLDLICRGIRAVSPDDQVALERASVIYDALYAQFASEIPKGKIRE